MNPAKMSWLSFDEFFALYLFYNSFAKILFSKLTYFEIKTIKK